MADKHNYKELLGARLEALHMEETKAQNLPTEEDMLRWEKLAAARRAEKKRHMRTLTSIAAAVLFIFAVGITIIIGPPNAEAGGDGEVVIKTPAQNSLEVVKYLKSQEMIPEQFFKFYNLPEGYLIQYIELINNNSATNCTIVAENSEKSRLEIKQSYMQEHVEMGWNISNYEHAYYWDGREVYSSEYDSGINSVTYLLMEDNIFIYIIANSKIDKTEIQTMLKEATY